MKGQLFPYKDDNVAKSKPIVTYGIIIACIAVFILSLTDFENIINGYGFTPANFVLITLFTSMFLHAGIEHLFGNLWYLWIFGDNVEDRFGRIKYILFYLASGIAATLAQYATDPLSIIPSIGASGAISGVLGAYLVFFPKVRVKVIGPMYSTFEIPAVAMIGFWFVLQFILGTMSLFGATSSIAFWAHVGGFVFGASVAFVYKLIYKE